MVDTPNVPGIYSDNQVVAWKEVTGAVHKKGSYIYLQLWALGRVANPAFLNQGGYPLLLASKISTKSAFSDDSHKPDARHHDRDLNRLLEAYGNSSPVLVAGNYNGDSAQIALDTTYTNHDVICFFWSPIHHKPHSTFRVIARTTLCGVRFGDHVRTRT